LHHTMGTTSLSSLLVPPVGTPQARRFRKYGRLGRMPGVIAVAAAIGFVCLAKQFLPKDGFISFEGPSSRRLLKEGGNSSDHHELHACEGITLNDFDENGGVVVYFLCMVYVFLGIAIICDDYFVAALEEITRRLQIPDDVAGATFMAAGSSAPEVATVVISTLIDPGDEGLGDVVGAAVFNSMTVVGLCAILAGQVLDIAPFPFTRDSIFYGFSIILLFAFVSDSKVEWWEGLLLLGAYCVYVGFMSQNTKVARALAKYGQKNQRSVSGSLARKLSSSYLAADIAKMKISEPTVSETAKESATTDDIAVEVNYAQATESAVEMGDMKPKEVTIGDESEEPATVVKGKEATEEGDDEESSMLCKVAGGAFTVLKGPYTLLFTATMPPCLERAIPKNFFMWQFVMSVCWIAVLTYVMLIVSGRVGCILEIPTIVMGMVIISAGTTVPDCLSSIIVSRAGQGDMAVCNAIGSNIFNIFIGLGLPWFLYCVVNGKPYESKALEGTQVMISILILVVYLLLLAVVLIISKWKLFPRVGYFLIFLHLTFIAWALLSNPLGSDSEGKPAKPVIALSGWEDSA